MSTKPVWTGWIAFAAIMLVVTGAVNVVEGIVALARDKYVVLVEDNLYSVDVTGWGWAVLISGVVLFAVGMGLFAGQTWARVTAIVVVTVHAVLQVLWIGAYPLWSLLMISLSVVVLFALTARWPEPEEPSYGPIAQPTGR